MPRKKKGQEKVTTTSADLLAEEVARLEGIFPQAFSEGKVDFEKLRAALGGFVDDRPERYTFSWAGKRDAIRLLQTPTRATLRPCREESVDFDTTQHLFIEGDNLEVLKLLYRAYFGRVTMIYIDPPYNTGNDFIYPDDYKDPLGQYLQLTGQADAAGNLLTSNPETSGRYHSAWLSMMYPRLFLARQLLCEDGVIFVSIDDHEMHNLRLLMNEIFGEENFVAAIAWEKRFTRSNNAKMFYSVKDSILLYRKSEAVSLLREPRTEKSDSIYSNPDNDPRGDWTSASYVNPATKEQRPNLVYVITNPFTGGKIAHPTHAWKYEYSEYLRHVEEGRLWWGSDGNATYPRIKIFLSESEGLVPIDLWDYRTTGTTDEGGMQIKALFGESVFDNPKPTQLVRRMIHIATRSDDNCLIVDFFAGSCTTAQSVLEFNRENDTHHRFVVVQLPEPTPKRSLAQKAGYFSIADIGKERIRRVIARMREEDKGKLGLHPNEDLGFKVFRLAASNYRPWAGVAKRTPDAYTRAMTAFADPLVDNWREEDVIYEVALKEGYGLNCRLERVKKVKGQAVYRVTDPDKGQSFTICLDGSIALEALRPLRLGAEDLFVCRDAALDDDATANLALQCRLKAI